jgi:hypothetical protein
MRHSFLDPSERPSYTSEPRGSRTQAGAEAQDHQRDSALQGRNRNAFVLPAGITYARTAQNWVQTSTVTQTGGTPVASFRLMTCSSDIVPIARQYQRALHRRAHMRANSCAGAAMCCGCIRGKGFGPSYRQRMPRNQTKFRVAP